LIVRIYFKIKGIHFIESKIFGKFEFDLNLGSLFSFS